MYIDTHTHIYSKEFDDDLATAIENSLQAKVTKLFLPAIDSEYHDKMERVAGAWPGICFPMMGLHPTSVREGFEKELEIVASRLEKPAIKYYAIGEIGIDLYWDKTFAAEQEKALSFQFDLAIRYNLPVVIHTRNSIDLVLDIVERRNDPRLRGIFHCFGGNIGQAGRVIKSGFLLGIGGVVTYKNSGLQDVVEQTELEHLVLETDAPWLTPVPHRGKRNEPSYIPLIAARIAEIKNLPVDEVARQTTENAEKIFRITD